MVKGKFMQHPQKCKRKASSKLIHVKQHRTRSSITAVKKKKNVDQLQINSQPYAAVTDVIQTSVSGYK